ncbi:MAG: Lrp/AsnC family transcriptional regulator [Alphaproteobacteria bacterium]
MKKTALDATDIRILSAVQKHGPLSKSRLADMVNLSPTPCWTRLDRLKKAGLIRGYHADIALDAIVDVSKVIVTVSLKSHHKSDFERFEARIKALDEITECVSTGGGMDYVMTVVASNLAAFQSLIDGLLAEELGIDRFMTYIVTRVIKSSQPNLEKLIDP